MDRTLLLHRSAAGPGKGWAGGRQLVEGADFSGTEGQLFFSEEGLCAAAPCPPVPGSSRQAEVLPLKAGLIYFLCFAVPL